MVSVGIKSLYSAWTSKEISGRGIYNPDNLTTHDVKWYERNANKRAAEYFGKKFNVIWNSLYYPIDYPSFKY